MPRSKEREGHRINLIGAAAGYLDCGKDSEVTLIEPLPDGSRLVVTLQILPAVAVAPEQPVERAL